MLHFPFGFKRVILRGMYTYRASLSFNGETPLGESSKIPRALEPNCQENEDNEDAELPMELLQAACA